MDKYHIYNDIGKGEFSEVFKGREKKCIEYVAIKRVEKSMMTKIVAEVQILHKFKHPHILRFYDWYETRNNLWLILEYCTGGDLAKLLKEDGNLTEPSVRMFGLDILAGLKYIHSLGIIHGDLQPKNFLIDECGIIKISDFKYARKIPTTQTDDSTLNNLNGNFLELIKSRGNISTIAPELTLKDGIPSYNSDLWSFGCLLYELKYGISPFLDTNTGSKNNEQPSNGTSTSTIEAICRDLQLPVKSSEIDYETAIILKRICKEKPSRLKNSNINRSNNGIKQNNGYDINKSKNSNAVILGHHNEKNEKLNNNITTENIILSSNFIDILQWLLEKSPYDRCSWDDIVIHPFWGTYANSFLSGSSPSIGSSNSNSSSSIALVSTNKKLNVKSASVVNVLLQPQVSTSNLANNSVITNNSILATLPPQPLYEQYIKSYQQKLSLLLYEQILKENGLTHLDIQKVENYQINLQHQSSENDDTNSNSSIQLSKPPVTTVATVTKNAAVTGTVTSTAAVKLQENNITAKSIATSSSSSSSINNITNSSIKDNQSFILASPIIDSTPLKIMNNNNNQQQNIQKSTNAKNKDDVIINDNNNKQLVNSQSVGISNSNSISQKHDVSISQMETPIIMRKNSNVNVLQENVNNVSSVDKNTLNDISNFNQRLTQCSLTQVDDATITGNSTGSNSNSNSILLTPNSAVSSKISPMMNRSTLKTPYNVFDKNSNNREMFQLLNSNNAASQQQQQSLSSFTFNINHIITIISQPYHLLLIPSIKFNTIFSNNTNYSIISLLQHASDLQVKPVVENKWIEIIEKPILNTKNYANYGFLVVDNDIVNRMGQAQLDTLLTGIYKALCKCSPSSSTAATSTTTATAGVSHNNNNNNNNNNMGYQTALIIERTHILTYILSLSSLTSVANTILNSQLLSIILRSVKPPPPLISNAPVSTTSSNQLSHHIYNCRVIATTILAMTIRYATHIPPPSSTVISSSLADSASIKSNSAINNHSEDVHILSTLVSILKEFQHNNTSITTSSYIAGTDTRLRRKAVAAFGELIFYIASQDAENNDTNTMNTSFTSRIIDGNNKNIDKNNNTKQLKQQNKVLQHSASATTTTSNNNQTKGVTPLKKSSSVAANNTLSSQQSSVHKNISTPTNSKSNQTNTINKTSPDMLTDKDSKSTTDQWVLPSMALNALASCLKDETDEVVVHYAAKTIENVLAQGRSEYKLKFCTIEIANRLFDIILQTSNESLQATCGMAVAHIFYFVINNPDAISMSYFSHAGSSEHNHVVTFNTNNSSPRATTATANTVNTLTPKKSRKFSFTNNGMTTLSTPTSNGSKNHHTSTTLFSIPMFFLQVLIPESKGSERLSHIVDTFQDSTVKLQQAYLNIINILFSLNLSHIHQPNQSSNSVQLSSSSSIKQKNQSANSNKIISKKSDATENYGVLDSSDIKFGNNNSDLAVLAQIKTYFTKSSTFLSTIMKLTEHGSSSAIKGKALLCQQLLFRHDIYLLSMFIENHSFGRNIYKNIEPILATTTLITNASSNDAAQNKQTNSTSISYTTKAAMSIVYCLYENVKQSSAILENQLKILNTFLPNYNDNSINYALLFEKIDLYILQKASNTLLAIHTIMSNESLFSFLILCNAMDKAKIVEQILSCLSLIIPIQPLLHGHNQNEHDRIMLENNKFFEIMQMVEDSLMVVFEVLIQLDFSSYNKWINPNETVVQMPELSSPSSQTSSTNTTSCTELLPSIGSYFHYVSIIIFQYIPTALSLLTDLSPQKNHIFFENITRIRMVTSICLRKMIPIVMRVLHSWSLPENKNIFTMIRNYINTLESSLQSFYMNKCQELFMIANQPHILLKSMMQYIRSWMKEDITISQHFVRMLIECLNIDNSLTLICIRMINENHILELLLHQLVRTPITIKSINDNTTTNNNNNDDSNNEITVNNVDPAIPVLIKLILELSDYFNGSSNDTIENSPKKSAKTKDIINNNNNNNNNNKDNDTNNIKMVYNIPIKLLELGLAQSLVITLQQICENYLTNSSSSSKCSSSNYSIDLETLYNLFQLLYSVLTYCIRNISQYQSQTESQSSKSNTVTVNASSNTNENINYMYQIIQPLQQNMSIILFKLINICYIMFKKSNSQTILETNNQQTNMISENFISEMSNDSLIPLIMETIVKCLTSLFDLFPEAISAQILSSNQSSIAISQFNNDVDVRQIISNIISDHQLDILVRNRLCKFLFGILKVAPMLNLNQPFKSFILEAPIISALNTVLSYDHDIVASSYNIKIDEDALIAMQYQISQTIKLARTY